MQATHPAFDTLVTAIQQRFVKKPTNIRFYSNSYFQVNQLRLDWFYDCAKVPNKKIIKVVFPKFIEDNLIMVFLKTHILFAARDL